MDVITIINYLQTPLELHFRPRFQVKILQDANGFRRIYFNNTAELKIIHIPCTCIVNNCRFFFRLHVKKDLCKVTTSAVGKKMGKQNFIFNAICSYNKR